AVDDQHALAGLLEIGCEVRDQRALAHTALEIGDQDHRLLALALPHAGVVVILAARRSRLVQAPEVVLLAHEGRADLAQFLLALLQRRFLVVLDGGRETQRRGLPGQLGRGRGQRLLLLLHLAQLLLQADARLVALLPGVVALLRGQPGGQIFQRRDQQGDRRQQQDNDSGGDPALVPEEEFQEAPINRTDRTHRSPTILSDAR